VHTASLAQPLPRDGLAWPVGPSIHCSAKARNPFWRLASLLPGALAQGLEAALSRVGVFAGRCAASGPVAALLHCEALLSEAGDCAAGLRCALSAVDVKLMQVSSTAATEAMDEAKGKQSCAGVSQVWDWSRSNPGTGLGCGWAACHEVGMSKFKQSLTL
jgi:hypothetical protein